MRSDKDYYAFDGLVGQQRAVLNLATRPADYNVSSSTTRFAKTLPAIFPVFVVCSTATASTSNVSGRWTLVIWAPPALVPTTSQYELLLGVTAWRSGAGPVRTE